MKCLVLVLALLGGCSFASASVVGAASPVDICNARFTKVVIPRVGQNVKVTPAGWFGIPMVWQFPAAQIPMGPAYVNDVAISDSHGNVVHRLKLIVPWVADAVAVKNATDAAVKALAGIPLSHVHIIHQIRVNPTDMNPLFLPGALERGTGTGQVRAAARMNDIELFPGFIRESEYDRMQIMAHEFGHLIATQRWGSGVPGDDYNQAAALDGGPVSQFAYNMPEDFAEAVRTYLFAIEFPWELDTRAKFSHRFAFLDGIFLNN